MSDNPPVAPLQSRDPITRMWRGMDKTQKVVASVAAALVVLCVACAGCVGVLTQGNTGGSSANAAATATRNTASLATRTPAGPTATLGPTATPKPVYAHFGDGTFQVGKDIKPGTYRTREASPGCYYERLKSFDGSFSAIIANNTTDNPAIVTIAATDKGFHTDGCGTWTADLSQITQSKTSFGDGMFIVGTDIAPGTYKSTGGGSCYWERLNGFGNDFSNIIANDNTEAATIVTIRSSDKGFSSEGCGPWSKA